MQQAHDLPLYVDGVLVGGIRTGLSAVRSTVLALRAEAVRQKWHVDHPRGRVRLIDKRVDGAFVAGRIAALTEIIEYIDQLEKA